MVCKELILKLENEVMTSTSNYGNQPLRGCAQGITFSWCTNWCTTDECHPVCQTGFGKCLKFILKRKAS